MTAVHKKHPADASAFVKTTADKKAMAGKEEKKENVVVSDVVTETTERIEVIEEVPAESALADPLTDFKEKMSKEEKMPASGNPPPKNFMWPILFVVFLALASLVGIFVYKQGMNKGTQVNVVTLSPTPTLTLTPTKTIDFTKYEISILNGSEVDGEAGRQKTNLEGEGFVVSSVGNADNSDYTKTIIQAKAEVDQAFLDKLKSALEKSFVVGDSEELSEDADSSVIVILGSETN